MLRGGILLVAFVFAAGAASAQDDPTVNESDFNTSAPEGDDSYLNETESNSTDPTLSEDDFNTSAPEADEGYLGSDGTTEGDPTLSEGDFDTSAPAADESYLDADDVDASGDGDARGAPGPALVALLAAVGIVAALARRR